MDILKARVELIRMSRKNLFKLALKQRTSICLIGGRPCCFHLQYKGSNFCVSEILGKGCQLEGLEQSEESYHEREEINCLFPFLQEMEPVQLREKAFEFNVYHRDCLTRSTLLLGKIIERRRKERRDNLKDLLNKALKQYSNFVEDPSTIFLLGR